MLLRAVEGGCDVALGCVEEIKSLAYVFVRSSWATS